MNNKLLNVKRRIFEIIEKGKREDLPSRYFDLSLVVLIVLNVIAIILVSVKSIYLAFVTFKLKEFVFMANDYVADYLLIKLVRFDFSTWKKDRLDLGIES